MKAGAYAAEELEDDVLGGRGAEARSPVRDLDSCMDDLPPASGRRSRGEELSLAGRRSPSAARG